MSFTDKEKMTELESAARKSQLTTTLQNFTDTDIIEV